ncbi:conjugal transfer protein TraG N-terminal domain-containing protein [Thiobacter aerophilum]|uniref:Conjugal transfer protein TraG N-terminal domain-containing protein n=1 Tax=Thiobacter aerophilum TaxID=3121275 RepID=A0ABV0EIX8_9BURK
MNYEVYSYWNLPELEGVFNAIAALTASSDFTGLLRLLALVAIISLVMAALSGRARHEDFWRWVIMLAVINGMLLVPKATVILIDRTSSQPPRVIGNVPIGLAALAHGTSKIGDWLTRAYETVFALPNDLQFQQNGMMFGHRMLTESVKLAPEIVNGRWMRDFQEFWRECVMPDIASGYLPVDTLRNSHNFWGELNNTNPALYVTLSTVGTVNCPSAYTDLTNRLDGAVVPAAIQLQADMYYPGQPANTTKYKNALSQAYAFGLNNSSTAESIVKQQMSINAGIRAYCETFVQLGDANKASLCYSSAMGAHQTNYTYQVLAKIAESSMPKVKSAIEIIQYAVFPIILAFAIVAGHMGLSVLKTYVMSLVWIQLWAPLYAVIHYIQTIRLPEYANQLAGLGDTLAGQSGLLQMGVSDQAVAGMLVVAIPPIAAALVKGGEVGLQAVAGLVSAPRTAEQQAAANAKGNESVGQWNAAPTIRSGVPNIMVAGEQGRVEQEGLVYRFSGSWGQAAALDLNRDGRITFDEITFFQGLGTAMFGGKAGLSLGQSRSDGIYSDESVQKGEGRAASLGDTQTARLNREKTADWSRKFTQALNREIGHETGGGTTTAAGHASNTHSEASGHKTLNNNEGSSFNSRAGVGAGPQRGTTTNNEEGGNVGNRKKLAGLLSGAMSASVTGEIKTAQQYMEAATETMKAMSQDDVRKSYDIVSRALKKIAGTTSDQGMRQAAERLAAALDNAKTLDSKELASIMEQASAGNRRDVTSRNAAEISIDTSRELFRTAWMMMASREGWDDTVTPERLEMFAREWNNNASFREDAEIAMLERLKGNKLMQTGVQAPLSQEELKKDGDAKVKNLEQKGNEAVKQKNLDNKREVEREQPFDARSMPSIAPAAQAYAEAMRHADKEVQQRAAQMHLEQGILTVANELYHNRQKGVIQNIANTWLGGIGSASPQEYATKLREAAHKDPELARILAVIGMNHEKAKILPTEENLNVVTQMAGRSIANAEGNVSTMWYDVKTNTTQWAKSVFSSINNALDRTVSHGHQVVEGATGGEKTPPPNNR